MSGLVPKKQSRQEIEKARQALIAKIDRKLENSRAKFLKVPETTAKKAVSNDHYAV